MTSIDLRIEAHKLALIAELVEQIARLRHAIEIKDAPAGQRLRSVVSGPCQAAVLFSEELISEAKKRERDMR